MRFRKGNFLFNKSKELNFTSHYQRNLEDLFTYQLTLGSLTRDIVALPDKAFDETTSKLDKMSGWYAKPIYPPKVDYFVVFDAFWKAAKRAKHPAKGVLWRHFVDLCLQDLDEKISNYCKPIQARYLECVQMDFESSLDWEKYYDVLGEGVWLDKNPLLGIKDEFGWSPWKDSSQVEVPKQIEFLVNYQQHGWTNRRKLKIFLQYGNEPNSIFQIVEAD